MVSLSLIDYGAGNLGSISNGLKKVGAEVTITDDPTTILNQDGIVMPGDGAFGAAMEQLSEHNLDGILDQILVEQKPFLGICLGLQLLFDESEEMGLFRGLGIIHGRIVKFPPGEKVPQMGWNTIQIQQPDHYLLQEIPDNTYVYFVHSFHPVLSDPANALALTTYGQTTYASMVWRDDVVASQFHPEKSGKLGVKMLENFVEHCRR
ncbi:MAG TPA: imidazole glycerol phosphate synthase subunit HisH [Candidatus Lokiarchaeia archaeon]|nr:imidazole glycerol phosphate synthase subunit HisH [Candidatus Lokiarchaeia archaeon]